MFFSQKVENNKKCNSELILYPSKIKVNLHFLSSFRTSATFILLSRENLQSSVNI